MGELRSLSLEGVQIDGGTTEISFYTEEAMRIKKVVLDIKLTGAAPYEGEGLLTKQNKPFESEDRGHIAYITHAVQVGGTDSRSLVVDFGNDYVEIEDEEYIHLRVMQPASGDTTVVAAVIYYERS